MLLFCFFWEEEEEEGEKTDGFNDKGEYLYGLPVCKFHTYISPSKSPEQSDIPSGEKQRAVIGALWPELQTHKIK
jgi:hypothetical protein